jgi:hypothetical protein
MQNEMLFNKKMVTAKSAQTCLRENREPKDVVPLP